jgi:hypothetical protein
VTKGDPLRVYPQGHPNKVATGEIVLLSENQNSLAVSFGEQYVPFINASTGMAIHPEHGKMLLLTRAGNTWHDVFSGAHFEIEEAT